MYIDELNEIGNEYNNTYHIPTKMKSVELKPSIYIDFNEEINKEGTKF